MAGDDYLFILTNFYATLHTCVTLAAPVAVWKLDGSFSETFCKLLFIKSRILFLFIFHISEAPISLKEGLWAVYNKMLKYKTVYI